MLHRRGPATQNPLLAAAPAVYQGDIDGRNLTLLKKIVSVGAWTMVSRLTGLVRDLVTASILGAGPLADAFFVAFRLPNHFRAIFGEGAFNAAFVPAYTRLHEQEGDEAAKLFQGRIVGLLLVAQIVLLVIALAFMPQVLGLIAPGFGRDDGRYDLAVELTRITFPYLAFITLATLYGAVLNAHGRFTAAAAAPILLNVTMVACLLSWRLFPGAGQAAAWGVTISGVLQLLVLIVATRRAGFLAWPRAVRLTGPVKAFFSALGPATIGSMGTQVAMFADTIIASLLPTGAVSSLYYADRVYQLPLGVIGIAAGTVLLPEMSRLIASGKPDAAHAAQNRTIFLTWLLTAPFLAGFLVVPGLIMQALFVRGAFTAEAATAAAAALIGYGVGLPAIVLIRSAVASFYARGDTKTPLIASFTALGANLLLKLVLMGTLHQAGLALATSIGAWINLALLVVLAMRRGAMAPDAILRRRLAGIALATALMAITLYFATGPAGLLAAGLPRWPLLGQLALTGLAGGAVYAGVAFVVLRRLGPQA